MTPTRSTLEDIGAFLERQKLPELKRRHDLSRVRWDSLERVAAGEWEQLAKAPPGQAPWIRSLEERTSIYVSGSLARYEAAVDSDLDVFVVDTLQGQNSLTTIETSHLLAALDRARQSAAFSPFSDGGKYVEKLSFAELKAEMGSPLDDAANFFTARILLLLNSRPLLNPRSYERARQEVLGEYWRDAAPGQPWRPILLTNDILRWWYVLALNFENRNPPTGDIPKRNVANLKLRYSRLLECFTPLLGLVHQSDQDGNISRSDADAILQMTPVERLMWVHDHGAGKVPEMVLDVLRRYDTYSSEVALPKKDLRDKLDQAHIRAPLKEAAYLFHDAFFQLFDTVGSKKTLYQYCVI